MIPVSASMLPTVHQAIGGHHKHNIVSTKYHPSIRLPRNLGIYLGIPIPLSFSVNASVIALLPPGLTGVKSISVGLPLLSLRM